MNGEYPRLLWSPDGIEVTVQTESEKDDKVAQGYTLVAPGTPAASEELRGTGDEPTFGPPDDDTYAAAKRGGKKK